jgi:hypothetical protein
MYNGLNRGQMGPLLRRLIDHRAEGSVSTSLRQRRFERFRALVAPYPRPLKILDIGGEQLFWELMGFSAPGDCRVVLVNLYETEVTLPNFSAIVGDATDLSMFEDGAFDVVFSNSVIEHVGDFEAQRRMAREVQRIGRSYFIQTPNRYFPVEPHFVFPLFQFLPLPLQVALVRHLKLGWYQPIPDEAQARALILSHRLLSGSELRALFPTGELYREKLLGVTKSFIAYGAASR